MMVKSPHRRARRTMRLAANSTCLHQIFATTRALSQRDPRRRPARHGCPVGIKSPAEAGQESSWKESDEECVSNSTNRGCFEATQCWCYFPSKMKRL